MLSFFIKRDLKRMSVMLDEIASSDTNMRLTTGTSDKDVAALAVSINVMLERNRREHFEKVRAEAALKRAVTNISHDLRTPLTSALGYLQMLESPDNDDENTAQYLEIIRGRLDALSELMETLFEFARIIEGATVINIQKVNIGNALRDALSEYYTELESKYFTVDVDIPDAPVICLCDKDALRRVLQNLLKNVYTHGREYLRVRLDSGMIEIANKADGLDELDTERIFERFYTADASRTSKNTGLGLAIVKELTARMGGQVKASISGDMLVVQVKLET